MGSPGPKSSIRRRKKGRILIDILILCPAHLLQQMSFPVPVMTVFVKLRIYRRDQKRLLCFLGYWADLWWVTQHSIQYSLVSLKPHRWQHSLLKKQNNFNLQKFPRILQFAQQKLPTWLTAVTEFYCFWKWVTQLKLSVFSPWLAAVYVEVEGLHADKQTATQRRSTAVRLHVQ